ncbi:MAG: hypothetical protein HY308_06210 [Gammaproteobacteria bacterium]|nr:hypothetical protein [Gammaproteobacteria bacterium]
MVLAKRVISVLLLVAAVNAVPVWAQQKGDFSLSYGAEYTTGSYDTSQDTDIWYFPFTFKYEADRYSVSMTAPLLVVDGPGTIVPGGDGRGIPSGRAAGESDAEIGVGDLLLKGSVNLWTEDNERPRIDVTGKVKFGTADEDKNLGTGENDLSIQIDAERNYGTTGLFGSLGYKFMGDPSGVDYDNVPFASAGAVFNVGNTTTLGATFDMQDNVLPGTPSQRELTLFMSSKADAQTRITGYVMKGLSDGSPDWGVGVLVKVAQ